MPLYLALIYSCNSVPALVSPSLCIFLDLTGKSQKYRYLQNKRIKSFDFDSRGLRQEGDITCTECANSLTRGMDYRIARSRNFIRMAKRIEKKLEIVEKKANKTGEIENTNLILRKILFGVNLNQTNPK